MTRYLVAFVLLSVYVAGSALVVRREGQIHREQLKQEWLASHPVASPAKSAQEVRTSAIVEPIAQPEPQPAPAPEHSEKATATVADISTTKPDATIRPQSTPLVMAPGPAVRQGPADPFWNSPAMKHVWDLSNLKTEDEKTLGRQLHEIVLRLLPRVKDDTMPRRAEEAAEPFVAARTRKDIEYTITVLDSDVVNAFSHPGGYVYVTSGLMSWIGEDDVPSLEFILAHEIAHVDLRHALVCLRDPGVQAIGNGTIQNFLLLIFPWGYYPDRLDLEADNWAYQQMTRLDRTKRERLSFLRKLEGYARVQGFGNGHVKPEFKTETAPVENNVKPEAKAEISPVENHLKAHLAPYKRLKALTDLTKSAPARAK